MRACMGSSVRVHAGVVARMLRGSSRRVCERERRVGDRAIDKRYAVHGVECYYWLLILLNNIVF